MLQKLPQSEGNVVGYAVQGKLREEDYELLDNDIRTLTQQYDQIRLLLDLKGMSGYDLNALDDDLRMTRYLDNFERMAIVSDNRLFDWMAAATDAVTGLDVRHFEVDEEQLAWNWLK